MIVTRIRCCLAICLCIAAGCSRHPEMTPQSNLDTADLHYRQGMRALDEGDLWKAQASFERARSLDGAYPGVAVGNALVASAQGEFFKARKLLEGALHADRHFADAHVAMAQVLSAEGKALNRPRAEWLIPARRSVSQATQLAPRDGSIPYKHGEIEFEAGEFEAARMALQQAIALAQSPWGERATLLLTRLQTIERAAPGSPLGARIATAESISRAELAVLLIEELQVEQLLAARRRLLGKAPAPRLELDAERLGIQYTWARPAIERLLPLGLVGLEPLPDGGFAPDAAVTRAELAMVADGLLRRLSDGGSSSDRYTGEPSRFSDIDSDHYAYAAIASVVDRGIMAPDAIATSFRPQAAIDGAEAIEVLHLLQAALGRGF